MVDGSNERQGGALTDLVTVLQQGVRNIGQLVQAMRTIFPQQTGTAPTASAGSATLPATPEGFIMVTLPDGTLAKIPYYLD